MADFTPVSAAVGGALIGLAAALLMLLTGRIAGISGIFGACLNVTTPDKGWRIAFIAGLMLAPLTGSLVGYALAEPQMPASWVTTVGGGLLVGFGTRQGGGCTSGHGVCGVARLSIRSIAATAIFMGTAVMVVFLARHVFGS
jgi:uncharacterized membrane protein YedE/YeeE